MRRILILLLTLLFAFYGVKAQDDATFEDIIVKVRPTISAFLVL